METKYDVTITAIGGLARTFLENNKSVILLDEGIRPNLSDMVVEHSGGLLAGEIKKGDKLRVGSSEYTVMSVGSDVNNNIKEEGHCTLVFNAEGSMPGQVILKGKGQPVLANGIHITFYNKYLRLTHPKRAAARKTFPASPVLEQMFITGDSGKSLCATALLLCCAPLQPAVSAAPSPWELRSQHRRQRCARRRAPAPPLRARSSR